MPWRARHALRTIREQQKSMQWSRPELSDMYDRVMLDFLSGYAYRHKVNTPTAKEAWLAKTLKD